MTLLRRFFVHRSADVVLAVIGLAVLQYRIVQAAPTWQHSRSYLLVIVALAPALIAIRRVDPVTASIGLTVGAIGSLLLGQIGWVSLVGLALSLWSLPSRCRLAVSVLVTAVVTALMVAAAFWHAATSDLKWWQAGLVLVIGLAALLFRRHEVRSAGTAWQRLDDVRAFVLDPERRWAFDLLLAFAAASLVLLELQHDRVIGNWWSAPHWMPFAIGFSVIILALRRYRPVVPVVVLTVASLLAYWQTSLCWTLLAALAFALFSLAVHRSLRFSLPIATGVLVAAPLVAWLVRYPQMVLIFPALKHQPLTSGEIHNPPDFHYHNDIYEGIVDRQWPVSLSLVLALVVLAGVLVRLYLRNRTSAAREAALEQRAVEQDAAQAVLTERSYIARDLHDVVAHAVNLMVIQAETGPDLLKRGDEEALAGFQRIGDAGRRALGELDRMLSALRDADGVPDPALTPQPGLGELAGLAETMSEQGLPVRLEVRGESGGVPDGIQLTAYRLVQEALTNVAKHAKATAAAILVERAATGVAVWVRDDGQGFDPAVRPEGRHGLTGMQERVRIHAGTLTITSAPGEGTTISAWLPLGTKEMAE
ncbi:ATP-binding protein [Kribbella sp. NPDC006257]|uniref:sensor histidine kinase n=1 Tax=Kribbella sp. NPDC006257 TaxID=3156738 RepID=UPI0033AF0937